LLDVVQLSTPPSTWSTAGVEEEDAPSVEEGRRTMAQLPHRISLQLDRASQDTLYCIHPGKAYAIEIPWLAVVADHLLTATERDENRSELMPALPAPRVEELLESLPGIVDGVAVGDALCDSALIVVMADGSQACLRHGTVQSVQGVVTPVAASASASGNKIFSGGVEAQIQRTYGPALKGPRALKLPVPSGSSDPSSGQRVLTESVAELRSVHVEYIYEAHHDLMERLEQIKGEVRSQCERAQRLASMAAEVGAAGDRLAAGIKRASWMADNLSRRHHLLAELHWALPRPRSAAELAFMRDELPAMEDAARRLGEEVAAVWGRAESLKRERDTSSSHKVLDVSALRVPPPQLRRIRELLTEHDRAIGMAQETVAFLESLLYEA